MFDNKKDSNKQKKKRPTRKGNILTRIFLRKRLPREQKVAKSITSTIVCVGTVPMNALSSRPYYKRKSSRRKRQVRKGSTQRMGSTLWWKKKMKNFLKKRMKQCEEELRTFENMRVLDSDEESKNVSFSGEGEI